MKKVKFHWFYDPNTDHTVCGGDCDDPDCSYGAWKLPSLVGGLGVLIMVYCVVSVFCLTCCSFSPQDYFEHRVGLHVDQDLLVDSDAGAEH